MKNISRTILITAAFIVLVSCKPNLKAPEPDKGGIDPSKYVAVGNSITAGFADGALYYDGQLVSYSNLLAEQLKLVGGGEFRQPLMPVGSVGVGGSGNAKYIMGSKADCKGVSALGPLPAAAFGDANQFLTGSAGPGPFNNMGVPGAKSIDVVDPGYGDPFSGFGNFNPFFTRMLSPSEYSTTILHQATKQNPTFFSVFIGNNDVLQYAANGGSSNSITPVNGGPGTGFEGSFDMIINAMTANGAKGVVANILDITSIPYFTTVPYNGLNLDATRAAELSSALAPFTFSTGANAFLIVDNNVQGGVRKIKSNELVILTIPLDSLKCADWGASKPIAAQYVLTEDEIVAIQSAIQGYNAKIKAVAETKGLAYVDVNALMAKLKTGITYNGIAMGTTFGSGGAFSLDGVHLTPRGNALLCNEFIKAINSTYGATIPHVDVSKYPGVMFP